MTQVAEAIARYHKLIESKPYIDLAWADSLQERLRGERLTAFPISPVLRPHFLSVRDFATLQRTAATLYSAIDRVEKIALATPVLLSRVQMLPAERMLASVDPGYSSLTVTGVLDANIQDGPVQFSGYRAASPSMVLHSELLADIFYDAAPVKEFRKKFKLAKAGAAKTLVHGILKAYKESGGKQRKPFIGIIEVRAPFQPAESSENALLAEHFRRMGLEAALISPEELEYKNNILRAGERVLEIVYRAFRLQEFLIHFDLNHPLVRAYKDRAICMINPFRSEMTSKRSLFDLLTDESVTAKFPAAERKVIKDCVPWTRVVQAGKSTHNSRSIDLMEYAMKNRAKLVLRPIDHRSDQNAYRGASLDDAGWEKALRQATRSPYVLQETRDGSRAVFPLLQYGSLVMKEMLVGMHPHAVQAKVHGASAWLNVAGSTGFSTLSGLAPTFLLGTR